MDVGLLISIGSLAASMASIAYAHSALRSAQEANKIGLHQTHRDMFDAILDFRSLFVAMDLHPTGEEMDFFYRRFVGPAQLYLPSRISDRSYEIYKASRELFDRIDKAESGDSHEDKWIPINELQRLGRQDLDNLIRDVATCIRIAGAQ